VFVEGIFFPVKGSPTVGQVNALGVSLTYSDLCFLKARDNIHVGGTGFAGKFLRIESLFNSIREVLLV